MDSVDSLPIDTASHPTRTEYSATSLRTSKLAQK